MTRSRQVTQTVSAMRKARAAPSALPKPAAMEFFIYEDNGGGYHWTIVAAGGETLVRSARLGSYEDAEQAARVVHRGASRASVERRRIADQAQHRGRRHRGAWITSVPLRWVEVHHHGPPQGRLRDPILRPLPSGEAP
jgi:uncharacterized protein YegP (UPF0339 family)